MKIKMSLAFLLSAVVALVTIPQLFNSLTHLFPQFSLPKAASLVNLLLPIAVAVLLYFNRKRDITKFAAIALFVGAASQLVSLSLSFQLIPQWLEYEFIPMASNFAKIGTTLSTALLMVTAGFCVLKKKNNPFLQVFFLLGMALLFLYLGLNVYHISQMLLDFAADALWFVALFVLPATLVDYDHAAMVDKRSLTVMGIVAIAVFVLHNLFTATPSGDPCRKSGCDNPAVTSGDSVYCEQHSNRCGNCGCYIDGDAMFCMDCIKSALQ